MMLQWVSNSRAIAPDILRERTIAGHHPPNSPEGFRGKESGNLSDTPRIFSSSPNRGVFSAFRVSSFDSSVDSDPAELLLFFLMNFLARRCTFFLTVEDGSNAVPLNIPF